MLSDRPLAGLVPDHLGFREPKRRRGFHPEAPALEMQAELPAPEWAAAAPAAPEPTPSPPSPEPEAAVAVPPPAPLPPRGGGETIASSESKAAIAPPSRDIAPPDPHRAMRALWRDASDWLELHRLCRRARCRHAGRCRGEPEACVRAGVTRVPQPARDFAGRMMRAQELGLSFEEAFEDAAEYHDGYFAWLAGLAAR